MLEMIIYLAFRDPRSSGKVSDRTRALQKLGNDLLPDRIMRFPWDERFFRFISHHCLLPYFTAKYKKSTTERTEKSLAGSIFQIEPGLSIRSQFANHFTVEQHAY